MWFLEALDPGSAAYNQLNGFRIRGEVDAKLLGLSLDTIVRRHESLRTNLSLKDGQVYQSISVPKPVDLRLIDLSSEAREAALDAACRQLAEEAKRPFDLASETLLRPRLIKLEPADFLLALITHHTIMDGWSMGILMNELSTIYECLSMGRDPASSLPPLPLQYADYSAWQRKKYLSGDFDDQLRYWLTKLAWDLPVLELPIDHRRPAMQPFEGKAFTMVVPRDLSLRLKAIGRGEKATLFMVLLAAFYLLLYRYTRQDEIIVGCPIAGRNDHRVEGIIGMFVNTLPLRCRISPERSFKELLLQVKSIALEAYDNQDLPFEKLVENLPLVRTLDRSPVFQALFQLRNFPNRAATMAGNSIERHDFDDVMAKVDLTLEVTETDAGLACHFEYPVALFERATIARMTRHWLTLLEAIAADPSTQASRLRMLTDEESRALLAEARGRRSEYPRDGTVPGLFRARARELPEAVAIMHGQERVTYHQLDVRSEELALQLRAAGVGAGEPVVVLMGRSAAMIAATLAVLKSGAAYVPLDPEDPDIRIAGIIEDVRARVVVTEARLLERAGNMAPAVIVGDGAPWRDERPDDPAPEGGTGPESLAYVMFTSGTTGKPKGVCISHSGIIRLVINTNYITIRPGDQVAHMSNPAFDATTFEIWGALLNGATLIVIDRDTALSPSALKALLDKKLIDVLFLTTPLFNVIAAELPASFHNVRDLLVGGDVLEPGPAAEILKNGPPGRLLNVYGPTENTTFSTWYHVKEAPSRHDKIPIGRPISNTSLYILDDRLQMVPVGVTGEIYLGGDGVSTGYFNRPDLDAKAFLPDPFRAEAGQVMYRTGDLGRHLLDGNIQFIGRVDGQAKIHGFRVETEEVTAALEAHPAVRRAVVRVFADPGGFKSLTAFLLKVDGARASVAEVRDYLAGKLPRYMVPSSMMWIDSLPLTPTGKVDHRALPAPTAAPVMDSALQGVPGHDPGSDVSKMTAVWREVLKAGHIGPDDDFFSLGGHSLLAIQLIGRIEEAFGVRLPIGAIFRAPTVRQLAHLLGDASKDTASPLMVVLRQGGDKPPLYCIPAVPGTASGYELLDFIGADQPVFALQSPGLDGRTETPDSVEGMASLYMEEIRCHRPHGPYHLLAYCAGGSFAYELAHQLESAGEEVGFLGLVDYPAPKQDMTSLFWSCYRFVMDNVGGATAHASSFSREDAAGKVKRIIGLPLFLVKKALRAPGEIASRPMPPPAPPAPYPDWVVSMPEPQRSVAMVNYDAINRYVPKAYGGKVTIFMAAETVKNYKRMGKYEATFGWKNLARGGVERYIINGSHLTLSSPDCSKDIARITRECMDRLTRAGGGRGR